MTERRMLRTLACLALLPNAVAGCSSSSSNPFNNTSDFDRQFIAAAQTWDLNKDGAVSCEEWAEYIRGAVRDADTNGDGALDAGEWQKLVGSDRLFETANLAYYDGNGDGRVTADEMIAKPNLAFKLLDRNNDCQIDRNESVQVRSREGGKSSGSAPDTTSQGPQGRSGGGY